MIKEADRGLKDRRRSGRLRLDRREGRRRSMPQRAAHPGRRPHVVRRASVSCVLFGNVSQVGGGVHAFEDARPDDGLLEVGVVTATTPLAVVAGVRTDARRPTEALEVRHESLAADKADVRLEATRRRIELDGGSRKAAKRLRVHVEPGAITVSRAGGAMSTATLVPETWELDGDDARRTLVETGSTPTPGRRVRTAARRRRVQPRALARVHDVARPRAGTDRARRLREPARSGRA